MESREPLELCEEIRKTACKYGLQIVYAFGSRSREIRALVEGRIARLSPGLSDVDVAVKPRQPLTVEQKVEIGIRFEDLFQVPRVDVVVLSEAPVFLAFEIVTGELLFAQDPTYEAEYQLYIMRRTAELTHYQKARQAMILGA
ncbi:MAG: nucleotidyltransferase domain-containing protein [Planctomycetota bacterium]